MAGLEVKPINRVRKSVLGHLAADLHLGGLTQARLSAGLDVGGGRTGEAEAEQTGAVDFHDNIPFVSLTHPSVTWA